MASTTNDTFLALRPLFVLSKRLRYHTGAGKMLDGLKYDAAGSFKARGAKDLPYIEPFSYTEDEDMTLSGAVNQNKTGNVAAVDVVTIEWIIGANRANGLLREDPAALTSNLGIAEWCALVRDALETNTSDAQDALLEGTIVKPIKFAIVENFADQLVWTATLRATLWTQLYNRGQRSCSDLD